MNWLRSGLAAGLVISGAATSPQPTPSPTVTIVMSSYAYAPAPLTLTAGRPVRLQFQNIAGKSHDFTAPEFFARAWMLSGRVPGGKISLGAGQTTVVDLVPAAGTYRVHCSKFLHSGLGMKAQIVVR